MHMEFITTAPVYRRGYADRAENHWPSISGARFTYKHMRAALTSNCFVLYTYIKCSRLSKTRPPGEMIISLITYRVIGRARTHSPQIWLRGNSLSRDCLRVRVRRGKAAASAATRHTDTRNHV